MYFDVPFMLEKSQIWGCRPQRVQQYDITIAKLKLKNETKKQKPYIVRVLIVAIIIVAALKTNKTMEASMINPTITGGALLRRIWCGCGCG